MPRWHLPLVGVDGFFGKTMILAIVSFVLLSGISFSRRLLLLGGGLWGVVFNGEFDPGSGRTLAACLTHASRAERPLRGYSSGERGEKTKGEKKHTNATHSG